MGCAFECGKHCKLVLCDSGLGITVSYWDSEAAIAAWKAHAEHSLARERGRDRWYSSFTLRVARVERAHGVQAKEAA